MGLIWRYLGNLNPTPEEFEKLTTLNRSIADVLEMTAESGKAHVLGPDALIEEVPPPFPPFPFSPIFSILF